MCSNARVAMVRCGFSPPFTRQTPLDAFWNVLGCLLAPHLLHAPHLNSPSRELLLSAPRRTIREMCVLETPTNIPQRGLRLEFSALCPEFLCSPGLNSLRRARLVYIRENIFSPSAAANYVEVETKCL